MGDLHIFFLYLRYSMRPGRLPVATDKKYAKETAVAWAGFIPRVPKSRTKEASLTPRPDMEMGTEEMVEMMGTNIKRGSRGTSIFNPRLSTYTAKMMTTCTIRERKNVFSSTVLFPL